MEKLAVVLIVKQNKICKKVAVSPEYGTGCCDILRIPKRKGEKNMCLLLSLLFGSSDKKESEDDTLEEYIAMDAMGMFEDMDDDIFGD